LLGIKPSSANMWVMGAERLSAIVMASLIRP
jgi:hypothetical protein